ncbi:MAG TPA: nucleotide sugar dehydrogenase, partial [Acidimicrobiia bacterium]|nr:nucleotide sugar dehydrogenase [Acidimicrobiia bacterium]
MAEPSERLAVLGQGYVGLILAARAVEAGYDVIGFDVDETRVGLLQAGRSYIEDVPSAQLAEMLGTGRFCASTDPAS